MKIFSLALLLVYFFNVEAQRKYCGDQLDDALNLICNGNYNSPKLKKNYDLMRYNDFWKQDELDNILPSENALATLFRKRSNSLITRVCCHRPCSIEELKLYCTE